MPGLNLAARVYVQGEDSDGGGNGGDREAQGPAAEAHGFGDCGERGAKFRIFDRLLHGAVSRQRVEQRAVGQCGLRQFPRFGGGQFTAQVSIHFAFEDFRHVPS